MSSNSDNSKNSIPPRPDARASEVPEIKVAPGAPEIRVSGVPKIKVPGIPEIQVPGIPSIAHYIPDLRTYTFTIVHDNIFSADACTNAVDALDEGLYLKEVKENLTMEEKQLELLEKASELERRKRKYKKSDPAETWTSYWIASSIAYLYPAKRREEWLGDLLEVNREMLYKGKPRWLVNLINFFQTILLIKSALQIKLSDFISWGKQKGE